ncbi:MAG: FtsX-like permease family protein [Pseudomonadota bacterium]
MQILYLKLFRDLWRIKGQALAIILVQASGISLLFMSMGMISSLTQTIDAYYDRYRFADVFAPATRAPVQLLADLRQIDGIAEVEGRFVGAGPVDMPQISAPISAQFVSRPAHGGQTLNDVHLVQGEMPDPLRSDEALLLQSFADAVELDIGDHLDVTLYGRKRSFRIVGIALSPEYVYALAPGAIAVDDDRFAVLWAPYDALAPAFNLKGAFNEAIFRLERGVQAEAIIPEIDRLLAPYGGRGAYDVSDQISNKFLTEELRQFDTMSFVMTPIFMSVTIFLLNVVISRMVQTEREQIGLLKAFGYTSQEIGWHYGRFAIVLALSGTMVGWFGGLYLGRLISEILQSYYNFPFLIFETDLTTVIYAIGLSLLGAGLGAFGAVRNAIGLHPAEAMRPPAPENFARGQNLLSKLVNQLDRPTRMILRRLSRRPMRAATLVLGISAAMALAVMMQFNKSAVDYILDASFEVIDRSDFTVSFPEPLGEKAPLSIKQLEGVQYVEPFRSAAVTFVHGRTTYLGSITGVSSSPYLNRVLDEDLKEVAVPAEGLLISRSLAKVLGISVGETVEVRFKEGRQPTLQIEIVGMTDSIIGTPAYMSITDLNKRLEEPGRLSGAYLRVDPAESEALQRQMKSIPQLAGVTVRTDVIQNFRELLAQGPGTYRTIMTFFATLIAIGVVYNGARITFGERQYDLASLRILGFSTLEAGYVVIGEVIILAILALPLGSLFGFLLWQYIATALSTELYTIPIVFHPAGFGVAGFTVLLAALAASVFIQRDVRKLDMVSALKARD